MEGRGNVGDDDDDCHLVSRAARPSQQKKASQGPRYEVGIVFYIRLGKLIQTKPNQISVLPMHNKEGNLDS